MYDASALHDPTGGAQESSHSSLTVIHGNKILKGVSAV